MAAILTTMLAVIALAGAQTSSHKPAASVDAELKRTEAAYTKAKTAYTKKPSAATKQALVVASTKFGTAAMISPTLDRKVKYKKALHLYREALKLDPKNAEAKSNSEMIISIYKSMGRPIPND